MGRSASYLQMVTDFLQVLLLLYPPPIIMLASFVFNSENVPDNSHAYHVREMLIPKLEVFYTDSFYNLLSKPDGVEKCNTCTFPQGTICLSLFFPIYPQFVDGLGHWY